MLSKGCADWCNPDLCSLMIVKSDLKFIGHLEIDPHDFRSWCASHYRALMHLKSIFDEQPIAFRNWVCKLIASFFWNEFGLTISVNPSSEIASRELKIDVSIDGSPGSQLFTISCLGLEQIEGSFSGFDQHTFHEFYQAVFPVVEAIANRLSIDNNKSK